jgi:phosphinothricin acetyltransferase
MGSSVTIRSATAGDAAVIRSIYEPYVLETAITFDYDVPSIEQFERRIARTLERYPYLVAVCENEVVGYAYAGTFKDRAAYSHSCELTIYVGREHHGRGVGRALYRRLEELLVDQGICNLYACVSYAEAADPYLTQASVRFHEALGFAICGRFTACGLKFGRWYDMVWMEKLVNPERR